MPKTKHCTARRLPCPAGRRCPDHKHIIEALDRGDAMGALAAFIQLRQEHMKEQELHSLEPRKILREDKDLFESPDSFNIPAKQYNAFHKSVITSLDNIGDALPLIEDNSGEDLNFQGRAGSTKLEAYIKNKIARNKTHLLAVANSDPNAHYELTDILDLAQNKHDHSDASSRLFADITLKFRAKDSGQYSYVPVNIKGSRNTSADNLAGWASLHFAFQGYTKNNMNKDLTIYGMTEKKLSQNKTASDYYIWNFEKDPNGQQPFVATHAFSLLEFEPSKYVFNSNQPFPIQVNASKISEQRVSKVNIRSQRMKWLTYFKQSMLLDAGEQIAKLTF